jgi:C4-dicarboxylate-specific signal transduction histidine kinase
MSMNKHTAVVSLEDRPALPASHSGEKPLPRAVEQRLNEAHECIFTAPARAVQIAEQAVAAAREAGEPDVLARTLHNAAIVLRRARRCDLAFALCLEAQPLLERLDDRWRVTSVLLERGLCYLSVAAHERALELFGEAATRFERLGDLAQLGRCYTSMAEAHLLGDDLHKAVDYAVKSLGSLDSATSTPALRRLLRNNEAHLRMLLGQQHEQRGEAALAQQEYLRASGSLPGLDEIDHHIWDPRTAALLDTMIAVHLAAGDVDRAQTAIKHLVRWSRRWNSPVEKGLAWLRLAGFRHKHHSALKAIHCARRAAAHLDRVPLDPDRVTTYLLLADLLEEVGDIKGAYEAHVQAGDIEAQQQREAIAMRAELLALDLEAEQGMSKSEQTLAYAQRLSNVGHMVASINHELSQPMSSIKMLAETTTELLQTEDMEEVHANLRVMHKLSSRLADLANQLAAFPAQAAAEQPEVNLKHVVDEALVMLSSRLAQTPCEITLIGCDIDICAPESQLVRVIANLLNNALDAMHGRDNRRVTIEAGATTQNLTQNANSNEPQNVRITVTDTGPGIAESLLERLFQPFFSTKSAGKGLGLGLALSRDVVREMGGDLTAANGPDGGAVFTIILPAAPR